MAKRQHKNSKMQNSNVCMRDARVFVRWLRFECTCLCSHYSLPLIIFILTPFTMHSCMHTLKFRKKRRRKRFRKMNKIKMCE